MIAPRKLIALQALLSVSSTTLMLMLTTGCQRTLPVVPADSQTEIAGANAIKTGSTAAGVKTAQADASTVTAGSATGGRPATPAARLGHSG
jgi:hypothetical protein